MISLEVIACMLILLAAVIAVWSICTAMTEVDR